MDALTPFLEFCEFGDDRVYLLLAIARSKDNPDVGSSDQPVIRKVVEDQADLRRKAAQLDHAVRQFDERFRLYVTANARDTQRALFELRRRMDEWIEMRLNGDEGVRQKFGRVDEEFRSVLQTETCRDETNFIFDLDDASEDEVASFREHLETFTQVAMTRETPGGYHVVTSSFNYNELDTDLDYELKTDDVIFVSYIGE